MLRANLRTCRRWLAEQDGRSGSFGVSMVAQEPDGEFASHAQTYAGTGTLRYSW
jgi:hypothetical protein